MSEPGVRPGGLTALAVINFVYAALELVTGVSTVSSPFYMPILAEQVAKEAANESRPEKQKAAADKAAQIKEANEHIQERKNLVMMSGAVDLFLGVLLVVSGIGYLKLRRFLGRTIGLLYATLAVAWGCGVLVWVQKEMGQSPGIFSLIGFIYPAVTIFALLVTFRDDFVNP